MKTAFIIITILLVLLVLIFFDYQSKEKQFYTLKKEYEFSTSFEQTPGLINAYFFEHGWFPDSLQQVDTIFNREIENTDFESIRKTPYRFFIDPFSGRFYHYIPVMNEEYNRPEGYYLLSTGVDSKIDNKELSEEALKLYDSASFNYLDFYFGKKDLLVKTGSIEDWLSESSGMETSMKWLAGRYDPSGKRMLPASVKFNGVVDSVTEDHFSLSDTQSTVKGVCYLAPSIGQLAITPGDTILVKGIYNKINFEPDTTFTFLNCIILERN